MSRIFRVSGFILMLATVSLSYLYFTQIEYISYVKNAAASQQTRGIAIILSSIGSLLGIFLCPFFLPMPGKNRKPLTCVVFVVLLFMPNVIIRFLGIDFYLGSRAAQIILSISAGTLYPLVFGFFFLSGRKNPALELAAVLLTARIIRQFSIPFLEYSGFDPPRALSLVFAVNRWLVVVMLISAIVSALVASNGAASSVASETMEGSKTPEHKPGAVLFLRLVILTFVLSTLNLIFEHRLFPLLTNFKEGYLPFFPIVMLVVLFISFISKKPFFLRYYISAVCCFFAILPCLTLVQSSVLIMALSTVVSIMHVSIWAIFPIIIMAHYKGGFWFYAYAASIQIVYVVSLAVSNFIPPIPATIDNMALLSFFVAVIFFVIAFKLLFQKQPLLLETPISSALQAAGGNSLSPPPPPNFFGSAVLAKAPTTLLENFTAHKLTSREIEIAELIFNGLTNKEISKQLLLKETTVKKYMTFILEKYDARSRSDFMSKAAFIKK
ncbi:MAG: helix-turn-helix transcriptional regulator [Treponema sp.]|jgi:DNA-binding CsgD family transcriptional regulator|nr:helix-turn-helix transcriptional regulator [Treponema sp.]